MSLEKVNKYIEDFAKTIETANLDFDSESLKVGVDLGTANICITVVNDKNEPVACELYPASVVKDGLVVDYQGAVAIVKELKSRVEARIGVPILKAAAAIPPGTIGKNASVVSNVIEAADIEVTNVVDEPTAAAMVLKIKNGAVVDVGGGTTGISIIKDGKVIDSYDEATGGSHMTLVVAGNYKISLEEAEKLKLNVKNHKEIFHIIKPVVEKMASIVARYVEEFDVDEIYVVGGASCFDGFEKVFEKECKIKTIKPAHPLLVTPLGIALSN